MAGAIIFAIIITIIAGFYIRAYSKYWKEAKLYSKEKLLQRIIAAVGLYLIEIIFKDKKLQEVPEILQLYGKMEYAKKLRGFHAERIGLVFAVITGFLLFAMVMSIKAALSVPVESVEKNEFGKGDKLYRYYYEAEIEKEKAREEYFVIKIPESAPNQEQKKEQISKLKEDLPKIILKENERMDYVYKPLNLPRRLSEDIEIKWESSNEKILNNNGQIRYNNLKEEGEEVALNAEISFYGEILKVKYILKLYKKPKDREEQGEYIKKELERELSWSNLKEEDNIKVLLPKRVSDYEAEINWFSASKQTNAVSIIAAGFLVGLALYFLKQVELRNKVEERQEELLREFPGFVNKMALLMNAGMTFSRAWEKIAADYMVIKEKSKRKSILYEEVIKTLEDRKKGVSEILAYEAFGQRCKVPEILRFTAITLQNIKKGSALLIEAISQQSKEAWALREDLARKKGEKAGTKLVLPMGIMLIGILVIVIAPAILSMKI